MERPARREQGSQAGGSPPTNMFDGWDGKAVHYALPARILNVRPAPFKLPQSGQNTR